MSVFPPSSALLNQPEVHLAGDWLHQNRGETDDEDIYRGERQSLHRSPTESSLSATSSSSTGNFGRGRLGAIAAVVEQAISRWARRGSSSSVSSSSSSSSGSSLVNPPLSQVARRRRRKSTSSNLHRALSDRSLLERISLIKAREESRFIPREFVLYLPPSLRQPQTQPGERRQYTTQTTSLSLIVSRLDMALKKSMKERRRRERNRLAKTIPSKGQRSDFSPPPQFILPDVPETTGHSCTVSDKEGLRNENKGKGKVQDNKPGFSGSGDMELSSMPKAWWLDVSSPSWEDIRAIGKLLHLHPLTLDDILQQEPREKLELFPKLGYYFVVFRALEGRSTQERPQCSDALHDPDGGSIGEAIVYLVVFHEGICSFHFKDISEHIDRVTNRVISFENVVDMSSDWIAHGMLDSIVDSFFPVLEKVEREVAEIEEIVFFPSSNHTSPASTQDTSHALDHNSEKINIQDLESKELSLQLSRSPAEQHIRFIRPRLTFPLLVRRFNRFMQTQLDSIRIISNIDNDATPTTLQRIARTRRMVTALNRLLASKSEVVTQIQKRLLTTVPGSGNGLAKGNFEVAIYMGDIQDHILTFQQSLAHYERMLSQSHPIYLAQLRTTVGVTKQETDKALIYLSTVSVAVLCLQTFTGIFSLNVKVPTNLGDPKPHYPIFGIIIASLFVILAMYLTLVRRWWIHANRRRAAL